VSGSDPAEGWRKGSSAPPPARRIHNDSSTSSLAAGSEGTGSEGGGEGGGEERGRKGLPGTGGKRTVLPLLFTRQHYPGLESVLQKESEIRREKAKEKEEEQRLVERGRADAAEAQGEGGREGGREDRPEGERTVLLGGLPLPSLPGIACLPFPSEREARLGRLVPCDLGTTLAERQGGGGTVLPSVFPPARTEWLDAMTEWGASMFAAGLPLEVVTHQHVGRRGGEKGVLARRGMGRGREGGREGGRASGRGGKPRKGHPSSTVRTSIFPHDPAPLDLQPRLSHPPRFFSLRPVLPPSPLPPPTPASEPPRMPPPPLSEREPPLSPLPPLLAPAHDPWSAELSLSPCLGPGPNVDRTESLSDSAPHRLDDLPPFLPSTDPVSPRGPLLFPADISAELPSALALDVDLGGIGGLGAMGSDGHVLDADASPAAGPAGAGPGGGRLPMASILTEDGRVMELLDLADDFLPLFGQD
jgi:hypothetical protein